MHKFVRSANRVKRALVIAILSLIQGCDPSGSVEPPHLDATTPPKTPVEVHLDATTPPKSPIKLHYVDAATPPKTPIKLHYPDAATPPQKGGIAVLVSVDWEGFTLKANDLAAMEQFRRQNKEIPFVHFLNAAYYTKFNADPPAVTAAIKRVLLPIDELGLHIHGWRSLFEAAGVKYRNTPRYDNLVWPVTEDRTVDVGETVQISAYSQAELERVIAFSVTTLEAHGFGRAKSFRAGAWLATAPVLQALVAEHFVYDHSAIPAILLDEGIVGRDWRLPEVLPSVWPDTTIRTQPYTITTSNGHIIEIPDNGALADWA